MSASPQFYSGEESNVKKSNDTAAQEIQAKNSDALDRESLSTCNGDEIATPSDHSSSSLSDHDLHSTSSEPVFRSHELPRMRNRPRAKSAPNILEQKVALFLRSVSDYINNSYGNNLPNAASQHRRASHPNIPLQQAISPLLQGETAVRIRRSGVAAQHSRTSMGSVPEEESNSGDEV